MGLVVVTARKVAAATMPGQAVMAVLAVLPEEAAVVVGAVRPRAATVT